MGDMGEEFKALRKHLDAEKQVRAEINTEALKRLNIPAREQSKNVFRVDSEYGATMYYPSSGKWQHRGKVYRGDLSQFREWLKRNRML